MTFLTEVVLFRRSPQCLIDNRANDFILVFDLLKVIITIQVSEKRGLVNLLAESLVDESYHSSSITPVGIDKPCILHGHRPSGIMVVVPEIHMSGNDRREQRGQLLGGATGKQVGVGPDSRLPQVAQRNLLFKQLMNMDKPQMTVDLLLSQFIPIVKNIHTIS